MKFQHQKMTIHSANYMHTMFAKINKYLVIQQQNKSNLAQFQVGNADMQTADM